MSCFTPLRAQVKPLDPTVKGVAVGMTLEDAHDALQPQVDAIVGEDGNRVFLPPHTGTFSDDPKTTYMYWDAAKPTLRQGFFSLVITLDPHEILITADTRTRRVNYIFFGDTACDTLFGASKMTGEEFARAIGEHYDFPLLIEDVQRKQVVGAMGVPVVMLSKRRVNSDGVLVNVRIGLQNKDHPNQPGDAYKGLTLKLSEQKFN